MSHPEYEVLNDYADGLLDEQAEIATQTHLRACSECSEVVEQIITLSADARSLPREVPVPLVVWENVRAATTASAGARQHASTRRMLWQLRYHLAAAAIVLLVAASTVTWYIASQRNPQVIVREASPRGASTTNLVAYGAVEAEYTKAAEDLLELLEQRRPTMDTAVVRSVEENLRTMDEAIRRARAALLSDPDNNDVAGILTATQESKLRMLRRAVGGAGGT
jgi:hypothetical protein